MIVFGLCHFDLHTKDVILRSAATKNPRVKREILRFAQDDNKMPGMTIKDAGFQRYASFETVLQMVFLSFRPQGEILKVLYFNIFRFPAFARNDHFCCNDDIAYSLGVKVKRIS